MTLNRRDFLRGSLLTAGAFALPGVSLGFGGKAGEDGGTVVAIYLRGGADGLNIVVPHGDQDYYRLRPTLAIPRPDAGGGALDLDGFFGLNPAFGALLPLYTGGQLAIVHAVGPAHGSRSHFDAQELMERGVNSKAGSATGWLGRAVETLPRAGLDPFISTAIGNAVPRSLSGLVPALGISSADGFDFSLEGAELIAARYAIVNGYAGSSPLGTTALQTLEAIDLLKDARPDQYVPAADVEYPAGGFGNNLRQLVQLLKADIGIRIAGVDLGGWDHHNNEVQDLDPLLDELGRGLVAMHRDLGALSDKVTVVVMSEFGRRAFQNGSAGTDHGSGNLMLVLGGGVNGGQVYAQWPGLTDAALDRGDLKITSDYRQVVGEVLARQLPEADLDYVLQDYSGGPALGLFG